jgi:pyocin large subunit-like protein
VIWKTLGYPLAALIAVAAIMIVVAREPDTPAQPDFPPRPSATAPQPYGDVAESPSTQQQYRTATPLWSPGPDGDPRANAAHHWQKHGSEFRELHSESEYIRAARAFVNHPPPGAQIKHDSRGDTLIYDPGSNTFAVRAPNGAPRTMFRPRNGRDYWERQP